MSSRDAVADDSCSDRFKKFPNPPIIKPVQGSGKFFAEIYSTAPAYRPPRNIAAQTAGTRHNPEAASQISETDGRKEFGKSIGNNCNSSTFPKRNRKLKLPALMILPGANPPGQHGLKRGVRSSTPERKQLSTGEKSIEVQKDGWARSRYLSILLLKKSV